jgi:hypothetical protein
MAADAPKKSGRNARHAVIVTLSGDRPIQHVTRDLKAKGFEVNEVLEHIGSVTGFAAPEIRQALRNVPGVADVSDDHPVDIGPPNRSIS